MNSHGLVNPRLRTTGHMATNHKHLPWAMETCCVPVSPLHQIRAFFWAGITDEVNNESTATKPQCCSWLQELCWQCREEQEATVSCTPWALKHHTCAQDWQPGRNSSQEAMPGNADQEKKSRRVGPGYGEHLRTAWPMLWLSKCWRRVNWSHTQPPLPLLQMHILASLLPRVTKLEMMGHGAERTCLCPSGVTNSDLLAQVGLCESFPKTAKPHLILPLPFLIAPIPFHAALEMPSINPGQLLQQELWCTTLLKEEKQHTGHLTRGVQQSSAGKCTS